MSRLFDIRKYSVTVLFFLILFYASSFFIPVASTADPQKYYLLRDFLGFQLRVGPVSYSLGFILLALISFLVFLYYRFYTASDSVYVAAFYALLVCTLPVRFTFEPFLIAVLLFAVVMIFQSTLQKRDKNEETAFMMMFLLALSSFFFSPLTWAFLLLLPMNIYRFDNKPKATANALLGFLFPYVMLIGGVAIFSGEERIVGLLQELWSEMTAFSICILPVKTASLIKNILFLIVAVLALVRILSSLRAINVVKAAFQTDMFLYLLFLTAISVLFGDGMAQIWMLPMIPFSALFYMFFTERAELKKGGYACLFLLLVLIAERLVWVI